MAEESLSVIDLVASEASKLHTLIESDSSDLSADFSLGMEDDSPKSNDAIASILNRLDSHSEDRSKNVTIRRQSPKKQKMTLSRRAGLDFPVFKMRQRFLKLANVKVSKGAAVYAASVIEYLMAEVLEASRDVTKNHKRSQINPRDVMTATKTDEELSKVFQGTITGGGVMPYINKALIEGFVRNKNKKRSKAAKK